MSVSEPIRRPVFTLTVDQASSSRGSDRVPELLTQLAAVPALLGFERTAGDELQGVVGEPDALVQASAVILRSGGWHLGIGVGGLDEPLPDSTRAARGSAFLAAREAVNQAKRTQPGIRVIGPPELARSSARQLETALRLWSGLLQRRTDRGWEVVDLLRGGLTHAEVGEQLGITQSAVTQRATAAQLVDAERAAELVGYLADTLVREISTTGALL